MEEKKWHRATVKNPAGKTFDVFVDNPTAPTTYKVYANSTAVHGMSNLKLSDATPKEDDR